MRDDPQDFPNDPFDDELDAAVLAAVDLIARTKRVGMTELELPLIDENYTWVVTVSRSTIYLMISRGEFPKQISLGARAVGWLKSEIDQWVESRINGRDDARSA